MSFSGRRPTATNGLNADTILAGVRAAVDPGALDVPFTPEWTARCRITADRLAKFVSSKMQDKVSAYSAALDAARREGDITSPLRVAHFIAQIAVESANFSRMEENLHYSDKSLVAVFGYSEEDAKEMVAYAKRDPGKYDEEYVGNGIYAGVNGNGDNESGDGYKFRGRGFIQLTARNNYAAYGTKLGVDLIEDPDLAADPVVAARIAARFWGDHHCNALADADNVAGVTRRINGGSNGLAERMNLTATAKTIWK